jgi:nitrite reductase (NADH) large subunit
MGTRVVCSGETGAVRPDGAETVYETHQKIDKERFSYSRLVYRDGLFVGYMLVGEPAKAFNKLQPLLNTGTGTGKINALLYNGSL